MSNSLPSYSQSVLLKFTVEVMKGPHAGLKQEFTRTSITVGRGPENDVVLANDPRVSRQHIEIKQSMGQFYLVNMSQKNFVMLNGNNASSEKIDSKSVIQIGESELRFSVSGGTDLLEPASPLGGPKGVVTSMPVPAVPRVPSPPPGMPPAMPPAMPGARPPGYPMPPPGYNPYAHHPQYAPGMTPQAPPQSVTKMQDFVGSPRGKLLIGLIVVGVLFLVLQSGNKKPKMVDRPFRTTEELEVTQKQSEEALKAFQERKDKMNQATFQKAYENFLRGYRDYRLGQYLRAKEAFQVVINLDPENDLAKRYKQLAEIKHDEIIKMHLLQGYKYLEKQNYRMCRASFRMVMTMLGSEVSRPEYREAKLKFQECEAGLDGRY